MAHAGTITHAITQAPFHGNPLAAALRRDPSTFFLNEMLPVSIVVLLSLASFMVEEGKTCARPRPC